jgi:hypothetical protein
MRTSESQNMTINFVGPHDDKNPCFIPHVYFIECTFTSFERIIGEEVFSGPYNFILHLQTPDCTTFSQSHFRFDHIEEKKQNLAHPSEEKAP